VRITLDL